MIFAIDFASTVAQTFSLLMILALLTVFATTYPTLAAMGLIFAVAASLGYVGGVILSIRADGDF